MRFRRNLKDEKTFKIAAIFYLIAWVIILVIYCFTKEKELIGLSITCLLISPFYFYITHVLRNSYVEFQKAKILLLNYKSSNIVIDIADVILILIPSEKALKNRFKSNDIIIKGKNGSNIISYSIKIEKYIIENIKVEINYYDNYSKVIK